MADFRRLYDFTEAGRDDLKVPADDFNVAERLDTLLVNPLHQLPLGSFGGNNAAVRATGRELNLAFRNLTRPAWSGSAAASSWPNASASSRWPDLTGSEEHPLTKEVWARSGAWPPRAQTGEGEKFGPLDEDHAA